MPFERINIKDILAKEMEDEDFRAIYNAINDIHRQGEFKDWQALERCLERYLALSPDNPYRAIAEAEMRDIIDFELRKKP